MRFIRIFLLLIIACVCVIPAQAQSPAAAAPQAISPDKEKAIRQLLVVTGTSKLAGQEMNHLLTYLQGNLPDVPPEVWTKMRTRMKPDDLITQMLPVWDKYYTLEDINGMLAFYQTPLGQKVIATMPQITRESMTLGQAWGEKQAQSVIQEVEQEEKTRKKHGKVKTTAP